MGCSTSKDGSEPAAAAAPGEFTPKNESINRSTTSDTVVSQPGREQPGKNPNTKEGQFELLAARSKTPNASNYETLIASNGMKEYQSKGISEEDIRSLFDVVDADHNGLINYKEYVELIEYIELAVAEKKRVASANGSRPTSTGSAGPFATTKVDNPVKSTKPTPPAGPVETPKPVVVTPPAAAVVPTAQPTQQAASAPIAVPEKAAEGPKRRPPSKRIVHMPTTTDDPPVTPVTNGAKVMMPFGVKSPSGVATDDKKKAETIAEGEEEEEDDDSDPNRPKQKKGFLINDDIGSSDPNAKNYYVLDNGKLKYMDHATKQYQVIPLSNRKVQVSSDGVIELVTTDEDAATFSTDSGGASPLSEDGRRNSLNSISPKSRISLRVKNDRDVDQWRAAIAEHQQYASAKEGSRVASMRLSSTGLPTETDSRKN